MQPHALSLITIWTPCHAQRLDLPDVQTTVDAPAMAAECPSINQVNDMLA